jgi:hypothetical protein
LEPGALVTEEKLQTKADRYFRVGFLASFTEEPFSSGPRALLDFLTLSITSSTVVITGLETTKATWWSPSHRVTFGCRTS